MQGMYFFNFATCEPLFDLEDTIEFCIYNEEGGAVVLVDFRKAFDTLEIELIDNVYVKWVLVNNSKNGYPRCIVTLIVLFPWWMAFWIV